jgi:hypothetical protein
MKTNKDFDDLPERMVFVYNYTLKEFCRLVNRSVRTITRKIKEGSVNPRIIKSQQGTLEYRFSTTDVKAFFWDELPLWIKSALK